MPEINLLHLDENQKTDLAQFLKEQFKLGVHFWEKGVVHSVNGKEVTLSHNIVWTEKKERQDNGSKKSNDLRFRVIGDQSLGKGSFGTIFSILKTLILNLDENQLDYENQL